MQITSPSFYIHLCKRQAPCVSALQEQTENGFSTGGSAVIDDSAAAFTSTGAGRSEGALKTWDDHRPITVHFGQVSRYDVVLV